MQPTTFGSRLRLLRLHQRLSQPRLAEAAGTSKQYISRLENDISEPGMSIIVRLADALGVSADELLGMDKEAEPTA